MASISIVMTAYKRAELLAKTLFTIYRQDCSDVEVIVVQDGDDGGATRTVCSQYPVRYFQRTRRPDKFYCNPAIPNNIGLRQATGDVVILQNAECMHLGETIRRLTQYVTADNAVIAAVSATDSSGHHLMYYTHPTENRRPFFFCGAMLRKHFVDLRGFDEDYVDYGCDDNDFADRLMAHGVRFEYVDVPVRHQWHPTSFDPSQPQTSFPLYEKKTQLMREGKIGVVRNTEDWGLYE